jgi:photosystem II stability/assembly factor-like uncharacterized protein
MAGTAHSQWTRCPGLYGGTIGEIVANGVGSLYASSNGKLFLSTDRGDSWTQLSELNGYITDIEIVGNRLIVPTVGGIGTAGCFLSLDMGETWSRDPHSPDGGSILSAFGRLFLAGNQVYASEDSGTSWQVVAPGPAFSVNVLAQVDNVLIGFGERGRVIRSDDTGRNWVGEIQQNLSGTMTSAFATSRQGQIIAAGSNGTFESTDYGRTWSRIQDLPAGWSRVIIVPGMSTHVEIFVAVLNHGVYRSVDEARSWVLCPGTEQTESSRLATNGIDVFTASTGSVIQRSSDRGETWQPKIKGITSVIVSRLAATSQGLFGLVHGMGVGRSLDNGDTWDFANEGFDSLGHTSITASGDTLYVGSNGLFRSIDNGNSWVSIIDSLRGSYIPAISARGNEILASTYNTIYWSSDWGRGWARGLYSSRLLAIGHVGNTYMGGMPKLLRSSNGGKIWSYDVHPTVTNEFISFAAIGTTLFGASDGVYATTDEGASWQRVPGPFENNYVETLLSAGSTLFAGTHKGFFSTTNLGVSWREQNEGFEGEPVITSMAVLNGDLYVGVVSEGVWRRSLRQLGVVSIPSPRQSGIILYPNPTDGPVHLGQVSPLSRILLTDVTGRRTELETTSSSSSTTVTLAGLSAGVYQISVINFSGQTVHTCVLKR